MLGCRLVEQLQAARKEDKTMYGAVDWNRFFGAVRRMAFRRQRRQGWAG